MESMFIRRISVQVDRIFQKEYTVFGDILEVEDLLRFTDFPLSPGGTTLVTSPLSAELLDLELTTRSLPEPMLPSPVSSQLTPDLIRDTRAAQVHHR